MRSSVAIVLALAVVLPQIALCNGFQVKSAVQCPPCSSAQCISEPCAAGVPYLCYAGPSEGGCAPDAQSWNNSLECSACCNTNACPNATVPPPTVTNAPPPPPTCGQCTSAQCAAQNCPSAVPYVCTKGKSAGGCAANAGYWNNSGVCTACCNSNTCPTNTPTGPTPTHKPMTCGVCSAAICASGYCPSNVPFVCTSGPARAGCSNNSKAWSKPVCDSCCDLALCPATPPPTVQCPPCSQSTCATSQCTWTDPFMCVSGTSAGGCSPNAAAWSNKKMCSSCCNAMQC